MTGSIALKPFFVYGTLLPGEPNDHHFADALERVVPARMRGLRLYDMGYFPMAVAGTADDVIHGALLYVAVDRHAATLAAIDALEGYRPDGPEPSFYEREVRVARAAGASGVEAWVYVGRPEAVNPAARIPGGDWRAYVAGFRADMAQWWATFGRNL